MSSRFRAGLALPVCALLFAPALAVAAAPGLAPSLPPEAAMSTPTTRGLLLPANTVVELEMVDAVSSETSKPGDFFKMRVAAAIVAEGSTLVPAGTIAVGQVVHAQRSRGGGKGGELILAARYLELPQGHVKLRSTFGAAGANRVGASLALSIAIGPLAMVVKGKRMEMPVGAPLSARIFADTPISSLP